MKKSVLFLYLLALPSIVLTVLTLCLTAYVFFEYGFDDFLFIKAGVLFLLTGGGVCALVFRNRNWWVKAAFYALACPYFFFWAAMGVILYLYPNFMEFDDAMLYNRDADVCRAQGGVFKRRLKIFGYYCDLPSRRDG